MGTNESMYAWMDEGFTSYAAARVVAYYWQERLQRDPGNDGICSRSWTGRRRSCR